MSEDKPDLKVEVFSAGCPLCLEKAEQVRRAAGSGFDVRVYDMHTDNGAERAARYGITHVPAVVVDGVVVEGDYSEDGPPEKPNGNGAAKKGSKK